MRRVRDEAIAEVDRLAAGEMVAPSGERWRATMADESTWRAVHDLIPDIVDQVLFELLSAVDNGAATRVASGGWVFHIPRGVGIGRTCGLVDDGGSDGWRARFSSQRFFDPFSELKLDLEELKLDDTDPDLVDEP